VSTFALAVVLVLRALHFHAFFAPSLGEFVGVIDMDVQDRCHVCVWMLVLPEMNGEVVPGSERVHVVVSAGGEPEPLIVVDGSIYVEDREHGIETCERLESVEDGDLAA